MPPAKDPLLKAGKAYFNEYDQTGAFSVVRKGLKIYRTECKMGSGQYTETVSKPKPKRTVKPESPRRDTTLDMVEPFTDLDVSTYSQYLALQKERASLSHDDVGKFRFEKEGKQRRLDRLQKKVLRETNKVVAGCGRRAFLTDVSIKSKSSTLDMSASLRRYGVDDDSCRPDGTEEWEYNALSSDEEADAAPAPVAPAAAAASLDASGLVFEAGSVEVDTVTSTGFEMGEDSLRLSLSASHASQLASSAASDSSSVSSRASSRSVEGDLVSVSSRESAEYPKITRTCIEGLVDGLDHERQKRWLRRQQAAYLRAKREAERKLKMENPTAEFVYGGPDGQTLMVKKHTGKVEKQAAPSSKSMGLTKSQQRRGSVIMRRAAAVSKSGMTVKQLEEYHAQLMHRIGACKRCSNNLSFCNSCKEYVDRYLMLNDHVREKYNRKKEEVYRHIVKNALDDNKPYTVGVGDKFEEQTLDVIKYLKAASKRNAKWLRNMDRGFYQRERTFKDELEREIYKEIDLNTNSEGVEMFEKKDKNGNRLLEIDPFFDKNVITDWVMNRGAEALYIPADVQRPWTGRRNEGEYPRKRDAGNTVRAEGVPDFVDVFRG